MISSMPACALVLLGFCAASVHAEDDLNTQLMRATVKIQHEKSTATGFILFRARDESFLLVTAAHVFDNTPGDETSVVFRTRVAEGEYAKQPTKLAIRKDGKPLWAKHPTEDIAAIQVAPPKSVDLPRLSTDLLATDERWRLLEIHPGENVAYLGFPHREESSGAGFPLLRAGPIASYPLRPTAKIKTFYLSANTFEGDSGGPVYLSRDKENVQLILGMVVAQRFLDEEMKMVYGSTKLRHRLGLAIVVHAGFIRETIDLVK